MSPVGSSGDDRLEVAEGRSVLALSLIQPFASLVAFGQKQLETRSWQTRYRGPLAIHASARISVDARSRCSEEPFRAVLLNALAARGISAPRADVDLWKCLPVGAILAVGWLVDCVRVESLFGPPRDPRLTEREEAFGDYAPGRWAWLIRDVCPLPEPIPARGRLGLWKMPADVERRIRASLGDTASFWEHVGAVGRTRAEAPHGAATIPVSGSRESGAMIPRSISGRRSPIIRVGDVVEILAACPSCGRLSAIHGVPGDWSVGYGCTCFPPAERDWLVQAASGAIREQGLVACPQCNRLMANACGARCPHCGFKFSCSGEP